MLAGGDFYARSLHAISGRRTYWHRQCESARGERMLRSQKMEARMSEVLRDFPANVVAFRGTGRITRRDYETVVIPAVEAAF